MKTKIYLAVSILMLVVLPLVNAFGLTTPFFGDIVNLFRGDETVITFTLQSMKSEGDLTVRVELLEGQEVAKFTDGKETYFLPAGIKDFPINLGIKIPDENPKEKYTIRFSVTEVASEDNKQVKIATGYEKVFYLVVEDKDRPVQSSLPSEPIPQPIVEPPKPQRRDEFIYAVIIIALVVIIYIIYRLVKRHREHLGWE